MYLTLIILPLLGSISSALFGRKLGVTGAHIITISCLILSSILTGIVYYEVVLNSSPVLINLGSWFTLGNINVNWEFYFDELSVSMLIPVIWISTLIHIYSVDYMSADPHNQRFFSYMSLFTFFMIILVTGNNYLIMFTGWEGIGISSYLLISYWFTRTQAVKSALMTLTMNRIGDMSISISMFIMLTVLNSLNYSTILSAGYTLDENIITLITLLLFIGAMAKSAQIPLHAWLPLSMEAATPISALIHAATLVTSGIYLMVRTSHLLEYSSTTLLVITIIGSLTLIISALSGLVQNDLKRIIAFSTISQLGYMFLAIGISNYNVALFHVINHAFFKAMLFLAAGAVIHSVNDQQDIRKLGGLIRFLPFIYSIIMIGTLSLMATPWLTGFYSKDLILELAYGTYSISGLYGYILGSLTAGLTAFYSFRLISMVFLTVPNANLKTYNNVHEANWIVIIPLTILAIFSIFYGYVCSDLYVGPGSDIFNNAIFIHPNNITIIEAEFSLPSYIKLLPSVFSISGALFAVYLYTKEYIFTIELTETVLGYNLYKFFNGKFYFEVIYNAFFVKTGLITGYTISKIFDRGIIELIGPFGITYSLLNGTRFISDTDQNDLTNINNYTLYIIFAFASLLLIALLPIIAILNITDYFIWAIIYTVALVISIN